MKDAEINSKVFGSPGKLPPEVQESKATRSARRLRVVALIQVLLAALILVLALYCGGGGGSAAPPPPPPPPAPAPSPAPVLSAFSPEAGPAGTAVTLTGTGFKGTLEVRFNGILASSLKENDDTSLLVTVPPGATSGAISVRTGAGQANSSLPFTVTAPAPTLAVTRVAPLSGAPGATVTLSGTGFLAVAQVTFGEVPALAISVQDDHTLTAQVPPTGVTGVVAVVPATGPAVTGPTFTVLRPPAPAPALADFTPKLAAPLTEVTVTGTGLTGVTGVTFGGHATLLWREVSDRELRVTVPEIAASGPLVVSTGAGVCSSAPVDFTVLAAAPVLTGLSSLSGAVGDVLTLTGAHLGQITAAAFAGVPCATLSVTPDGLSLQLTVPAGAVSGPVTVSSPAGSLTVPGGDFTVLARPAEITAFSPDRGVPGTEVTLEGGPFTGVTEVSYAGVALPAGRYDLVGSNQIRVRVPDDASTDGVLAVTTGGGRLATPRPFTLVPSRRSLWSAPLVRTPLRTFALLDYPVRRRTEQYHRNLPQAPIFHAYNIDAGGPVGYGGVARKADFTPLISFKLPGSFYEMLPQALRAQVQAMGLAEADVDILVASQDYFYDGVTPMDGIYLFRPHYWVDPDAPYTAVGLNHPFPVPGAVPAQVFGAAFYETEAGFTVDGHGAGTFFEFDISVHSAAGGPRPSTVVSSNNTQPVAGLDLNRSTALWSLTRYGPRAAATLHLLFADGDQATLENLSVTVHTFRDLLTELELAFPPGNRPVTMLQKLARPLLQRASSTPLGSGRQRVTVTGTCLGGTVAATFNGVAAAAFQELSDAMVTVDLPAGASGNLTLTTAMGESAPLLLP